MIAGPSAAPVLPRPPQGLVDALRNRQVVAVVGSGLSCAADALGWYELMRKLVEEADGMHPGDPSVDSSRSAIERGDVLAAGDLLKNVMGPEFVRAVIRQINDANLSPTLSHRLLRNLPLKAFVTTNYDTLIERAHPDAPLPAYSSGFSGLARLIQNGGVFIYKVHGDVNHPQEIVLARSDYNSVINNDVVIGNLRTLIAGSVLLWIGYGHNDLTLDLTLDFLVTRLGAAGGYAIARRDRALELRFEATQITPSWVEHADIPRFLRSLVEQVNGSIPFEVMFDNLGDGDVAREFESQALALHLSGGSPSERVFLWKMGPEPDRITLETKSAHLNELRTRMLRGESTLLRCLEDYHVTTFDDVNVSSLSVASPLVRAFVGPERRVLELTRGNIVQQRVAAIVTSANSELIGGGGVDGAVHLAAGPELLTACRQIGRCDTGSAVITRAFRLEPNVRHVIHAVGPIYGQNGGRDDQLLASTYKGALRIALASGCESVAFPSISTGLYRFPHHRAARVAIKAVVEALCEGSTVAIVRFVLGERALGTYHEALRELAAYDDRIMLE